jgi:hypothetical protein
LGLVLAPPFDHPIGDDDGLRPRGLFGRSRKSDALGVQQVKLLGGHVLASTHAVAIAAT